MFLKNVSKKRDNIFLAFLIFNLVALSVLFVNPMQTQACIDPYGQETKKCHSCNSAGNCVDDPNGPYWCAVCQRQCKNSPPASSGGCTNPADVINVLTEVSDSADTAETTKNTLIDIIQNNGKIPEDLKPWLISTIQENGDMTETAKTTLINAIQNNEKIPDDLKSLFISAIQGNLDITGLIKNKILSMLMKGLVDIEHICKTLSDIVAPIAVFGTTIGTPIALAISQICPIILDKILTELGFYEEKLKTGESTQIIIVPTLESYEWEVGIPGFIKPGQRTEFK